MVASDADVVLDDRYHLRRRIGVGGMGEVWEAEDLVLKRAVAVKIVGDAHRHDESVLARFEREARTGARLTHRNLATVFDYGEATEGVYLVMELFEGETLAERLRRGPMPAEEAAEVVARAADGIAAAHAAGVVHRDVKPSNLMLTEAGTKVMDFGIATGDGDGDPLTATGMVIGTAAYLAPERVRGEPYGPPADVYALGAVLFEAIAGRRAFGGTTPAEVAMGHLHGESPDLGEIPGVPGHILDVGRAALAKDPAARPTATHMANVLRGTGRVRQPATTTVAPAGAPTTTMPAAPAPPPARTPPPEPKGPRAGLVVVGLLLLLAAAAGVAYALASDDGDGAEPGPATSAASTPTAATALATVPATPTTLPVTTLPPETTAPPTTLAPGASGDLAQAAVSYVELLDAGDFESAWARTSPEFQAAQDRGSWEGYWGSFDSVDLAGEPEVDERSGTVVLPLSYDGRPEAYQLTFVTGEDGSWLVDGPVGR